ncbi:MAG TPA: NAD-binding protein [Candidatus Baltobacteraceae bacterium]|nr:NAD-binding protein [Candidatus Baltobacteraceae bacterium]
MEEPSPQGAPAQPSIIIVGGDALALKACQELTSAQTHSVTVIWPPNEEFGARVERFGARYVAHRPNDVDVLREAGVLEASAILTLTDDDHLNLLVGLKARDLNPDIRLVMRQFNRTLGRKLEQNLTNCSVISLSSHSAATYAGTALDYHCFYGLQFPDIDGPLVGFARRTVARYGVNGMTVPEAEQHLSQRIVALEGQTDFPRDEPLRGKRELTTFGVIRPMPAMIRAPIAVRKGRAFLPAAAERVRLAWLHLGGVVRALILAALALYAAATIFFAFKLHVAPLTAAYFVTSTMSTTGYGDITPRLDDRVELVAAMLLMAAGVTFTGVFVAVLTSRLTQAQWVAVQGLRRIKRRGHIIVCGSGNVGSRVIDYLLRLGQQVVVIEATPKPSIVELSRDRQFDLLTGDATLDTTLDLCNIPQAEALIALTNSDTMNLEIALGARARNPEMSIVIRVQEAAFEESVRRHFGMTRTYATAALAAPVLVGLAHREGARGRVEIGGREYSIGETVRGRGIAEPPAGSIPLAVWRDGDVRYIVDFSEAEPRDRVLFLYPLG